MCLFVHNKYVPLNINTCQTLYLIFVKPKLIKVLDILGLDILGTTHFFTSLSLFPPPFLFLPLRLPSPSPSLYSPSPLLLPPAPPGQVDNTTVRSENLSLRRTRLTWAAPENNNAQITNYWITYCIPLVDLNDTCRNQTAVPSSSMNPMEVLADINPERRYRVTIQAENVAGRGPESQPYFFNSATAGRCCYIHV